MKSIEFQTDDGAVWGVAPYKRAALLTFDLMKRANIPWALCESYEPQSLKFLFGISGHPLLFAGDLIELRVEMDLVYRLTACPAEQSHYRIFQRIDFPTARALEGIV